MPEAMVLIVDDDRTIVRFCQRLLEKASYQVVTALKPMDALKILEEHKVDLLLTDIRMPVMDGFELIARAKEYQPGLPVLVMTGFGSVDTAIQALHRGVDGLILKPFENSADLVQAVQRVLAESRQRQDAARLQVLRPLFDVSETLLAETSLQSLEVLIINAIEDLFRAASAGIWKCAADGSLEAVCVTDQDQDETHEPILNLLKMAVGTNAAQMVNSNGPGLPELQTALRAVGWEAALVAQVKRNEQQFVFSAGRGKKGDSVALQPFTEADLEMFVILARQSAVALENARLYSELKDYVRRVEDSQRALIQAEKMAAVGRLMASLAHEINNPLQAVRNCLHLASRRNMDHEQRFNYLEMSHSELDRLVNTVRRMLDFSRNGQVEQEEIDLNEIIARVLALLDTQMQTFNIQIHHQHANESCLARGVSDQIQQVFFNLLINAMDALENVDSERHIWIDVERRETDVRVFVEDSGPGISQEMHGKVFEPFVSTKKRGTGLGLAVSYGIIERHKGSLGIIQPRYGNGACFEMLLPVELET